MTDPKDIPEQIETILRRRHWTQTALAGHLRVWKGTVSRWKSGDQTPDGPAQVLLDALESGEVPAWLREE